VFYGWYIVIAVSLIAGFNSFLYIYGFTSFINPVINTFGWTRAQVSTALSLNYIIRGVLDPFMGFLVDRWYDMEEGDVLFAPRPIKHGTRNPAGGSQEPFICLGSAAPPQADLYTLAGYL